MSMFAPDRVPRSPVTGDSKPATAAFRSNFPPTSSADVDLHTSDGHIDLEMPVTTEGKIRQNEIHGKLNGGGSLLTIRTGDGSIHLRKG